MLSFFNFEFFISRTKSRRNPIVSRSGMTLIEILIVMALVGGLFTVLVTTIMPRLSKAQRKQAELKMQTVMQALDLYRTDCQKYPSAELGLRALLTRPSDCKNWGPEPYIKNEGDLADSWGNEFVYESQSGSYVLKSYGKDGTDGGSGNAEDFTSENL